MSSSRKILFSILRTVIGIALVVYLWRSGAINWAAMAGLATQWKITLAVIVLLLLDAAAIGWRLRVLLDPSGFHLPMLSAFRLTMIGVFFNSCLPGATGGDLVKIYYATEGNPGRRTAVGTIVLLDRAAGMFALMLLPLLLLPFFPELPEKSAALRAVLWVVAAIAAVTGVGTLMCFSERIRRSALVEWAIRRLPLGRYIGIIYDTVHAYREHPAPLFKSVAISLAAHMLAVSVAMLSALATHPEEFSWKMCVIIPIGFAANALPVTPGGLGVGEAAFDKLFALAGLSGGAEALLGWRVLTILISPLGLVYYLQGRRRFVHDAEAKAGAADG
ncbi:MAG: flippase-like domain-containing protein [Acidobacteria bacterium]|nr:flippase-like domain-containing protein [Acidobacteriota bacterium]MCL5289215.1 flippase-like domain-containing protein [Acidobacteriota bacterium]